MARLTLLRRAYPTPTGPRGAADHSQHFDNELTDLYDAVGTLARDFIAIEHAVECERDPDASERLASALRHKPENICSV